VISKVNLSPTSYGRAAYWKNNRKTFFRNFLQLRKKRHAEKNEQKSCAKKFHAEKLTGLSQ